MVSAFHLNVICYTSSQIATVCLTFYRIIIQELLVNLVTLFNSP